MSSQVLGVGKVAVKLRGGAARSGQAGSVGSETAGFWFLPRSPLPKWFGECFGCEQHKKSGLVVVEIPFPPPPPQVVWSVIWRVRKSSDPIEGCLMKEFRFSAQIVSPFRKCSLAVPEVGIPIGLSPSFDKRWIFGNSAQRYLASIPVARTIPNSISMFKSMKRSTSSASLLLQNTYCGWTTSCIT